MTNLKDIEAKLKPRKKDLAQRFSVKKIGVFGSTVMGERKKTSDVDILVEFKETPGIFGFLELEEYLSKMLGTKVDLVTKRSLKPVIGRHILQEVVYL